MYMQRGTLFSVEHHGDQACPHSFFISSKPAQSCLFAGRVRDTAASEQVSSPLDKRVVQHPFHLNSLSGVDAPYSFYSFFVGKMSNLQKKSPILSNKRIHIRVKVSYN